MTVTDPLRVACVLTPCHPPHSGLHKTLPTRKRGKMPPDLSLGDVTSYKHPLCSELPLGFSNGDGIQCPRCCVSVGPSAGLVRAGVILTDTLLRLWCCPQHHQLKMVKQLGSFSLRQHEPPGSPDTVVQAKLESHHAVLTPATQMIRSQWLPLIVWRGGLS